MWAFFIALALLIGGYLIYSRVSKKFSRSMTAKPRRCVAPMAAALVVTTLVLIGGSYLFAVVLRMGAIGAYIALAADECIRGVIILIRWQSGKWEKKALVKTRTEENQ